MGDQPTADAPSFLAEVGRRARAIDLLVLVAAPVALLGVAALPGPVREGLVYLHGEPALLTAFTAHYVHLEAAHLLGNLAIYLLIAPAVYLNLLLSGRREEFLATTATILLVFPLVITALHTLVVHRGTLVGFSGLAMAFVGVLPVAVFLFIDYRTDPSVGLDDAPSLFFVGIALIALRSVRTSSGLALSALAAALAALYLVRIARHAPWPSRRLLARSGYLELVAASPVLFVVALLAGFPTSPAQGGTVVDVFGHLLGYTLGFLGSYLTVRLERAVSGDPDYPSGDDRSEASTEDAEPSDADGLDVRQ